MADVEAPMRTFECEPFHCPNCDHRLVLDAFRSEANEKGRTRVVVMTVIDDTTWRDPELERYERGDTRSLGRAQLVREVRDLRRKVREFEYVERSLLFRLWQRVCGRV